MARVNRVEKSRKEQKCSKCGIIIPVGGAYVWAKPRYGSKIVRCTTCGIKSWETSGSDYVRTIGSLQDEWRDSYGVGEGVAEEIAESLEELRDNCQDSLDNMPEALQYGPTGEMLQERIDNLDSVIDELGNLDPEEYKAAALDQTDSITVDTKEFINYYGEDDVDLSDDEKEEETLTIALSELPNGEDYDAVQELPFIGDDDKEALSEAFESALGEAIDEILGELSY